MQQTTPFTWIINPDAENELSQPRKQGTYHPSIALTRAIDAKRDLFLHLANGDPVVFSHELGTGRPAPDLPVLALAWCPTASLKFRAQQAGFILPRAPGTSVLRSVHHKQFVSQCGLPTLPGREFVQTTETWNRLRTEWTFLSKSGSPALLRLKRPYGFSGRGQRVVSNVLSEDDSLWIQNSLKNGGFVCEPELVSPQLYSVHGLCLSQDNLVGTPVILRCDRFGAAFAWEDAESEALRQSLRGYAHRAGEHLLRNGYFGAYGIDFAQSADGTLYALDLNPRFTLGWSRGLGPLRAQAIELLLKT